MLRTRYASRLQRKALSTIDWMLSSQASDVINQFHIHRLRTGDPVGGGTWQFAKRDTREHGTTEMAGSEWGKPYSWSIKLCKSAPAKSAVGDHIPPPPPLSHPKMYTVFMLWTAQKEMEMKDIFRSGQDSGTKTFTFFKNVWLDNRFFKLSLIVFSSLTQIFERTIVCQNVLGTALADQ